MCWGWWSPLLLSNAFVRTGAPFTEQWRCACTDWTLKNAPTLKRAVIQILHILDAHSATTSWVLIHITALTLTKMPLAVVTWLSIQGIQFEIRLIYHNLLDLSLICHCWKVENVLGLSLAFHQALPSLPDAVMGSFCSSCALTKCSA